MVKTTNYHDYWAAAQETRIIVASSSDSASQASKSAWKRNDPHHYSGENKGTHHYWDSGCNLWRVTMYNLDVTKSK